MSNAAAAAAAAPPAGGGKKKLLIIAVALVLLLAVGGGVAAMLLKKKPADAEEGDDGHGAKPRAEAAHGPAPKPRDPSRAPTFVPLEPFTVNLADREAERYAQVAVTLEVDDAKTGEQLKTYLPAIRNNILLTLSSRTAEQLLSREGKERLSRAIVYASVQPLGYQVDLDDGGDEDADDPEASPKKKKRRARQAKMQFPVVAVHYSTFIVQ